MRFSRSILALASTLALTSASPVERRQNTTYCPGWSVTESQRRDIFDAFVQKLYIDKDVQGAFETYVSPNLTEHNPTAQTVADDISFLSYLLPQVDLTILHQGLEDDIGAVHQCATGAVLSNKTAIGDIYRFDGSCIVEHWDVIQATDADTTNPNALC